MKPEFESVSINEILALRHRVLRSGKPLSTAHFKGDTLENTFHYAAFFKIDNENLSDVKKIVGCVSFMANVHNDFDEKRAFQLRGMAVDDEYRQQHIGRQLLMYAEKQIRLKSARFIWCNVRASAIGFYTSQNYLKTGETFEIQGVGSHILMYKYI